MIEAMACGTPVIAWRSRLGAGGHRRRRRRASSCDSMEEAVAAVGSCRAARSRRTIRAVFERRFTSDRMAARLRVDLSQDDRAALDRSDRTGRSSCRRPAGCRRFGRQARAASGGLASHDEGGRHSSQPSRRRLRRGRPTCRCRRARRGVRRRRVGLAPGAPAAHAEARRYLRGVRPQRRRACRPGQSRRPLRPRHPLSVALLSDARRHASDAAELDACATTTPRSRSTSPTPTCATRPARSPSSTTASTSGARASCGRRDATSGSSCTASRPCRAAFACGSPSASDFADLFEVRGTARVRRGTVHPAQCRPGGVTLVVHRAGRRDPRHRARLRSGAGILRRHIGCLRPRPRCPASRARSSSASAAAAAFRWRRSTPGASSSSAPARRGGRCAPRRPRAASIATSNAMFNEAARRSISDLYMLVTETRARALSLRRHPLVQHRVRPRRADHRAADAVARSRDRARRAGLPRRQPGDGQSTRGGRRARQDPARGAPRRDGRARRGAVPPLLRQHRFDAAVRDAGRRLSRAHRRRRDGARSSGPTSRRRCAGSTTTATATATASSSTAGARAPACINQGWKDSHDSIFHADGTLADGPIALVEVQAYVYGAWTRGRGDRRARWATPRTRARCTDARRAAPARVRRGILRRGTRHLRAGARRRQAPCRVRASNAGHALFTGIALPERAPPVAAHPDVGRVLLGLGHPHAGVGEARYNPMSYHNGSIWPHDNALIAAGLARYGYRAEAARIFEGLFDASTYIDLRRLPELFCGFAPARGQGRPSIRWPARRRRGRRRRRCCCCSRSSGSRFDLRARVHRHRAAEAAALPRRGLPARPHRRRRARPTSRSGAAAPWSPSKC